MELPRPLRAAIDAELAGVPAASLRAASDTLTGRYRAEVRDGRLHLSSEMFAKAYIAARMPATFAALMATMSALAEAMPDFAPKSLLDIGAGPGTSLWAATETFAGLEAATLLEASTSIRQVGERLANSVFSFRPDWRSGTIAEQGGALPQADLVTLSYVLDELDPNAARSLVDLLWSRTTGVLLLVEPGTPAGWRRILAAREQLLKQGAFIVAPCPHHAECPVEAPDWCHFTRRVARSRVHLRTKSAEVPWEDEKFSYLAVSRTPSESSGARVLSNPDAGSGKVRLKLCESDGALRTRLLTKRDGAPFRAARRLSWGDTLEL